MTSITQALTRFIVATDASRLGRAEVEAARRTISDCIGCIVAGVPEPSSAIVRRVAAASSAEGRSTVAGWPRLLSAQAAAFANGTAAHALDYDDILWTLSGHPSVTILSASLAVAEAVGASGRDLLLAYALGVEVGGKLGRWVNPQHYAHGWHATASIGVIASAAACASLMRLDERSTAMALGIAASQAGGVRRNFGTMTKPFHAGNAARGAVVAAELAREGFTADLTAIEGEFGWARTLNGSRVPITEELAAALGRPWELLDPGIVIKRYPACGATHCALDAMLALQREHRFRPDEIERIVCEASPFARTVLLYPRPTTALEGKFSMEFSLAVAAIEGAAGLRQYTDEWVRDARVQALLPRIVCSSRADLATPGPSADAVPAEVTVHARGTTFRCLVRVPSGDPRNPIDTAVRREKFLDCTRGLLSAPGAAEALFERFEALESAEQVSALLQPLRSPRD